jgi:hypothetical protein
LAVRSSPLRDIDEQWKVGPGDDDAGPTVIVRWR